jgi:hypothetical protein
MLLCSSNNLQSLKEDLFMDLLQMLEAWSSEQLQKLVLLYSVNKHQLLKPGLVLEDWVEGHPNQLMTRITFLLT